VHDLLSTVGDVLKVFICLVFEVGRQRSNGNFDQAALPEVDVRALDPAPHLARVRGRVELVHGADDDVIPFEHAHLLAQRLPNADPRVHVTGLYGHTGASFGKLLALPRELATMIRVLRILA